MKKRTAAIFLTLALCLTLLPTAALAAEGDTVVVKPEIEYGGDYINCTTDTVIDEVPLSGSNVTVCSSGELLQEMMDNKSINTPPHFQISVALASFMGILLCIADVTGLRTF